MDLEKEILRLLAEDGRLTAADIAERLNISAAAAARCVAKLESDGVIVGYRAMFDETLLPENAVKAIIEVKLKPERDGGFDRIAKKISKFSKVESVYLVSGGSDLVLEVKGEDLKDVAEFVAEKLSIIDGVVSTSTHFLLKKYKELGKMMQDDEYKERLSVTP
ncbi:MAG: Lrp/AsnC family transcriptional regulator [Lentisphaeria bacterium]|nr:Lrp/AsnC family transcriptional regulator [Lentisphaeria bacterium]